MFIDLGWFSNVELNVSGPRMQ